MWVKSPEGLFNTDNIARIFQVGNTTFATFSGCNINPVISYSPVLATIEAALQNGDDYVEVK